MFLAGLYCSCFSWALHLFISFSSGVLIFSFEPASFQPGTGMQELSTCAFINNGTWETSLLAVLAETTSALVQ